ncbi:hypothetical protein ACLKA6_000426 [Drosophila palustris]
MVCLNKSDLRILTGYLTGPCGLRYHLKKLNLSDTETCRFCALEQETSEHVLCECPALCRQLNFGFSSVFIRVYKSDAAVGDALPDKPVEEDIAAELEAPERPDMEGYTSDASSLTRDLKKLWQAGDLEVTSDLASDLASDEEDANITAASAALLLRLAGGGADIVLIQEPWVVGGKVSGLGSADYKLNEDNTAVSLELRPAPIRLLSSYMAYDQEGPIPEDIARSLVSDCASNKIGLIIGCDAKAHHTQWGSSNVNTRENILAIESRTSVYFDGHEVKDRL